MAAQTIAMQSPVPPGKWYSRNGVAYTPDVNGAVAVALVDVVDALQAGFTPVLDGGSLTIASDGLTAHAGGGQGAALALTSALNRVTTVATAADSVKLPPSAPGLVVYVVNSSAKPMQVFGAGTDTINGVATATGISQPPNSIDVYACTVAGSWYVESGVGFSGSLFCESAQDSITANPGGGQAGAVAITTQTARVTTVATAGDSVKLPATAPGLEILVINHGANPMQVFGAGTDTVNDVAAATGVSQMPGSMVIYSCAAAGNWYSEGLATGFSGSLQTQSFVNALTAFPTGGQTSATPLTAMLNRVTTVATAGDSVKLPASAGGLSVVVSNADVRSCNVFPASGETINALGANNPFSLAAGATAMFYCTVAGTWHATLTSPLPSAQFQSAANTTNFTATGAQVAGGNECYLALTGALGSGQAITLPTAAQIVAAIPNAAAGQTYKLRIINRSGGAFAWTVTTNTGLTLTGTMTIAQNTWRDFVVTLTTLTAVAVQAVGTGTDS